LGEKLYLAENKDVEFGYKIAKGMVRFGIGQTVVELVKGTDERVKHVYKLGGENSIVVKVAKLN
jgi:DUF1009 family protein